MSILVNSETKVIVQGMTGKEGTFHATQCIEYGTKILGGVTPGKGGSYHLDIPIFNTVREAVEATNADASLVFVPPAYVAEAIMEAVQEGINLIVTITEGAPTKDIMYAKDYAKKMGAKLIGPNCPGVITPEECKIGIMPGYVFKKGHIGIISKSGTLTYEASNQIVRNGLGISTAIGIGGDPIIGLSIVELLEEFENDSDTDAMVVIGEIGGTMEIDAAEYIKNNIKKPVVSFIAGKTAPKGKRMGHAGAIISGGKETAIAKMEALKSVGVHVVENPAHIGSTVKKVLSNIL
ncbi:MAG: succinate--CoA ligase subunit alpha [Deferribacterota bacterium]|nr:succinate--CoA ligase subunit alpha [Deferribacterota bacterium]